MNKEKSPAFQYYPRDVLTDTRVAAMSLEQFGAYWALTSYIWLEGSLPLDEKKLARLLRVTPEEFSSLWPAVKALFKVKDGNITSPELDEQRKKQAAWRLKSAEGGRKSGEARRKGGSRLVQAPFKQSDSRVVEPKRKIASSSSSASSTAKVDPPPTPPVSDKATDKGEGGTKISDEQQSPSQQQSERVADLSAKAPTSRQRTPKLAGGAESPSSRHPRDVRREYADAHNLGDGWMTKSESGKYDLNIDEWLCDGKRVKGRQASGRVRLPDDIFENRRPMRIRTGDEIFDPVGGEPQSEVASQRAAVEPSKCPDCDGSGWMRLTPEQAGNVTGASVRCSHKKLYAAADSTGIEGKASDDNEFISSLRLIK